MSEFFNLLLPWQEATDDQISDVFVYIIGAAFLLLAIYFAVRTVYRYRLIKGLVEEVNNYARPAQPPIKQQLKEKFDHNSELAEAWQEFEDSLITRNHHENQIVYKTDEASLFFSEERLLEQYLNLRFWNNVPALLVGLGILGTFVGLVWGLRSFSGIEDFTSAEMEKAIKELLPGVSTAFVTSVWGMFASLLFNGLEKGCIGRVSRAIAHLQRALDRLFTLTTQEEISFRQEDELTQQTQALKSFSTDLANNIKGAMAEGRQQILSALYNTPKAFSSAMAEQLAPSFNTLNTTVEELRKQKEESSIAAIQQLVDEFQKSLSGAVEAQMETLAETIGKASESLITLPNQTMTMVDGTLNAFQSAINAQQEGLSDTTDRVNEEMRQIAVDIRDLLESTANRADEQMEQRMADMGAISNQSIQTLQTAIAELGQSITSTASQTASGSEALTNRMRELLESVANRTDEQLEQRLEAIETVSNQSIQAFQTMIDTQQSGLSETTDRVNQEMTQIASGIRNLLETAANQADQQLGQRMVEVEAVSNQSIQTLQTAIAELGQSITSTASQTTTESETMTKRMRELLESVANRTDKQLEQRIMDMETVSNQSIQTLQSTITQLQQSLISVTSQTTTEFEAMTKRMRELFEQTANQLGESIQDIEKNVRTLLQQQVEQIEAINVQLNNSQDTLTKGREMLEQMNTSVKNIQQLIETTEKLSGQLMAGAKQIESAGQGLTNASEVFNQENEKYLTANRETMEQIQAAVGHLNDSVQRFQTIDDGLRGVFAEIEKGLHTYATTSRESINQYLSSFSDQLAQASRHLSGSVEALAETVEEVTDMNERLARQGSNR